MLRAQPVEQAADLGRPMRLASDNLGLMGLGPVVDDESQSVDLARLALAAVGMASATQMVARVYSNHLVRTRNGSCPLTLFLSRPLTAREVGGTVDRVTAQMSDCPSGFQVSPSEQDVHLIAFLRRLRVQS